MLVCHVSLRPRGRVIASNIVEAALAGDTATTGNVVFATLVDDPASVRDFVDAYLGEIMKEAASAAATVNAGLVYAAAITEAAAASDVPNGHVPSIYSAAVAEATSAASAQDATATSAPIGARTLSAGRAGQQSVIYSSGTLTQIASNVGVVS